MIAKYNGSCSKCRGRIVAGQEIYWDREARKVSCLKCAPGAAEKKAAIDASRAATPEQAPAAYRELAANLPVPDGLAYLPFQKAGIASAYSREATLFGDEPGLGKTIQAIGISNCDPSIRRVVIVCPASLKLNWKREWEKWDVKGLTVGIASTSEFPATDVVILNWDIAGKLRKQLDAVSWDLAIADEAHFAKNPKAQRSQAVCGKEPKGKGEKRTEGDPGIRARRKLALTGTPIPNRPIEIQPILSWLAPNTWRGWFRFALRYAAAHQNRYGWDFSGASNLAELQAKLRSSILVRRLKQDVLTELPAKRRQVVVLAQNGCAEVVRKEAAAFERHEAELDELRAQVELAKASDNEQEYKDAVARLSKAARVAFTEISLVRHETAVAKAPAVVDHCKDLLEGSSDDYKLVVFAHHHDVIDILREGLAEFGVVSLTGETPNADRQAAVDAFQTDPKVRVFVASILAAGVGLTLTASSHVVFAELDWVPGNVSQAEDRTHRIGQRNAVLVQHLVLDGSLDAKIVRTLIQKQEIADLALDREPEEAPAVPAKGLTVNVRRQQLDELASKITRAQIEAIHEGLRILAGQCDGARTWDAAGFSKIDVSIGHSLANAPRLSPRQAALGLRLVIHYKRQISPDLLARARGEAA